jgi:predicted ATPase
MPPRTLPSGTVTFLFSDIEGSTKLLHDLGAEAYAELLMRHREIMRSAFAANGGVEIGTEGDSFFVAFPTAAGAVRAAAAAQKGLAALPIRVRIGIHTGTPDVVEGDYVGMDVHRAARIAAAGHGGQVLLSASTVALVAADGLRDLGEHRLKDLSAPERIHQLGTADFPRLRSLHQTNLPVALTPFVGRERELSEVTALLAREDVRIATLTGPGGTGKTRLAMQAAAEASSDHPHGVWWVPLDALRQPELVLETAAQIVGAKDALAAHIGDRTMLLAFDNFEQVVEAAAGVADLLRSCPNLDVLVTSREPLRIRGEREYAVPPLAHEEAVRLFWTRAREVRPDIAADDQDVSEICRRLDDLPLAIELAAARAKVLSPAKIRERLEQRLPLLTGGARDLPERQRTLRGTIEWSHELLTPDEQRLFARLAVFRGGWTLEAAEAVADADLDVLQSLVEKSLVRQNDERFSMLETIREYATERLEASGELAYLGKRHADHFLALAKEAEPIVLSVSPREWLDRLEMDHDNIRAALEYLEAARETQLALELGGRLWEFWCLRSHATEGWERLEHLLTLDAARTRSRAKALVGSVHLADGAGVDPLAVRQRAEEAIALEREVGDEKDIAFAEYEYASTYCNSGDFARARPLLEESVRRLREVGDEHRELQAMRLLAWACQELGEHERHRVLHEEVVRRARAIGDMENTAFSLSTLSWYASRDGRHGDALALLAEAYQLGRHEGDLAAIDLILVRVARALAFADSGDSAARVLGAADATHENAGWTYPGWVVAIREAAIEKARSRLSADAFAAARAEGRALTPDAAMELAQALSTAAAPRALPRRSSISRGRGGTR